MKIALFSAKAYDRDYFEQANQPFGYELDFFDVRLDQKTARLAFGYSVVCAFVNDDLSRPVLEELAKHGTRLLAMRCAGYNNVDLAAAKELGITVVRVPAYSPEAVAEHSVGLMMTLNRRIHKAYQRTRDANFALDGLVGFNMFGKTAGIIGTGKIGIATLRILKGFGMRLLVSDPFQNQAAIDLGAEYVDLDTLFRESDVISLHCPLFDNNKGMINQAAIAKMKPGVLILNTSRGPLINEADLAEALKSGRVAGAGVDVLSCEPPSLENPLLSAPNCIVTPHIAWATKEARSRLMNIAVDNLAAFIKGKAQNVVNA